MLIFLDEPTTGLDSFTATSVMETLKDLSKTGRTIIQTIHQPNSDIYELMDRLMLLAKGEVIFFNEAHLAVDYFSSINFKCPELSNPSDYFMSIMSIETIQAEEGKTAVELYAERIAYFSTNYQRSSLKTDASSANKNVLPISEKEQEMMSR